MNKKTLSFFLTLSILFAIALPQNVYASLGNETTYENIYLISDNHSHYNIESSLVTTLAVGSGLNATNNLIHIPPLEDSFDFFVNFADNVEDNSIVIVDIQKRIPKIMSSTDSETDKLNNAFWLLKSKNCKTLFISGNDEDNLQDTPPDYLEFLDYVDVHVNDDFIFLLAKAAITKMENLFNSGSAYNFCIIIDNTLSNLSNNDFDFAERWLFPYIESIYQDEYTYYVQNGNPGNYIDIREFLAFEKNIALYGQTNYGDNTFYNYLTHTTKTFSASTIDPYLLQYENVCMYSKATLSQVGSFWNEFNRLLSDEIQDKLFSMVYQTEEMDLSDLEINPLHNIGISELMFFDSVVASGIYTLNELLSDFINNADMQKYNNMSDRRCAVTYMPMFVSSDGWIPSRLILPCLQTSLL